MGRQVDRVRKLLNQPPRVLEVPEADALRLKNYQDFKLVDQSATPSTDARTQRITDELVEERLDDRRYLAGEDLAPMSIAREAVDATGNPQAAAMANKGIFDAISAESPSQTRMFRDTFTGNAPTRTYRGTLHSARKPGFNDSPMGFSDDVAVSEITPWNMLDGLTGNKRHSDLTVARLNDRNLPHGVADAEIYNLDNFVEHMNTPFMVYRAKKDGLAEPNGLKGFMQPESRSIFLNRSGDQMAAGPFEEVRRGLNAGQHEGIHAMLHGEVPSREYVLRQSHPELRGNSLERPAIGDIDRSKLILPEAQYLASTGQEMGNLLFHTKRLTETVMPGMRDVGATQASLDNFLNFVRNYKLTGRDPVINLKGHPNEGAPAHGFERQIEALQQIMKAHGPDGAHDFETNMNFKTSSTDKPNLRTALLA